MPAQNWTNDDLKNQFNRVKANGWLTAFQKAGTDYSFPVEVLLGIASRETNMQNIVGDGDHGFGIMQIDIGSYGDWCTSGAWKDVGASIQKGALVLNSKRDQIRSGQGQNLTIGHQNFVGGDGLTDDQLLRISIAAYNAGLWAYYGFSVDGNPDEKTTQGNYSADTLRRAAVFKTLLSS